MPWARTGVPELLKESKFVCRSFHSASAPNLFSTFTLIDCGFFWTKLPHGKHGILDFGSGRFAAGCRFHAEAITDLGQHYAASLTRTQASVCKVDRCPRSLFWTLF